MALIQSSQKEFEMAKKHEFRQTTALIQGEADSLRSDRQKARFQNPCLIVIRGKAQGHRFFITKPETFLGRDGSADIILPDQNISRRHAWIIREEGVVKLRDVGSANGIYVNDRKMEPKETVILKKEDMIRIGSTVLKFLPAGEIESILYDKLLDTVNLDALTQVFKRAYLMDALEAEFKRAKALKTDLALIFFIIDHFKLVNDNFGHDAGDCVLRDFAATVKVSGVLGPHDILARYGGEEFVLILPGSTAKSANTTADRLQAAIEAHAFIYEGTKIQVTSSYGISELSFSIESAQTLLKLASKTLDEPRKTERNQIIVGN